MQRFGESMKKTKIANAVWMVEKWALIGAVRHDLIIKNRILGRRRLRARRDLRFEIHR